MPRTRAADPAAFLPLKPNDYLLLLALADGDRHAYAIKKEVARRTGNRVRLGPGTLHRSIADLLHRGLVEESPQRPDPDQDDQRRRYYRLTRIGRGVVSAETDRLAALVAGARRTRWAR